MKKILDVIKIMFIILGIIFVLFILFIVFCFNKGYIKRNVDEPIATESISVSQTNPPTAKPTAKPTVEPTKTPTKKPTKKPTKEPTLKPTQKPTSKPTKSPSELSEKEYKAKCEELFYDDVFFGDEDLEGKLVKLNLFLSEKYYFTSENMYSDNYKQQYEKYAMKRDFFECSVLRKDTASYVGKGKVKMWFTEKLDLDANDYKTGQKITVYAEVVSWSNNTWDGYNKVTIIPKYIENN